jgi:hypothetical protein
MMTTLPARGRHLDPERPEKWIGTPPSDQCHLARDEVEPGQGLRGHEGQSRLLGRENQDQDARCVVQTADHAKIRVPEADRLQNSTFKAHEKSCG